MTKYIDHFIDTMAKDIENAVVLPPEKWLERAFMLNTFRSKEIDKPLYTLNSVLAKKKAELMRDMNMTSAKSKTMIEAEDDFLEAQILKAKQTTVTEYIRIAKLWSKTVEDEYKSTR